jgi:hypothetical protein
LVETYLEPVRDGHCPFPPDAVPAQVEVPDGGVLGDGRSQQHARRLAQLVPAQAHVLQGRRVLENVIKTLKPDEECSMFRLRLRYWRVVMFYEM